MNNWQMLAATAAVTVGTVLPVEATTLTGFETTGADMAGMEVTINYAGGGFDTAFWSAFGGTSGGALGSDWSLSNSGNTFASPWNFNYTGSNRVSSLVINAIPGKTVFDIGTNPSTPQSFGGQSFDLLFGLAPTNFKYSVPIDISTGDLFGTLSLFWDKGFTSSDTLSFRADTDNATDFPEPKSVPEPTAILSLLAIATLGLTPVLKPQHR